MAKSLRENHQGPKGKSPSPKPEGESPNPEWPNQQLKGE
jgi:hypothetical protein